MKCRLRLPIGRPCPLAAVACSAGLAAAAAGIASGPGRRAGRHAGDRRARSRRKHKRILNIFLHGGVSQLETWDPKPNTDTGGPFRAIPTSVPGIHICELLPHTAKQMHHLAIVRSLNTKNRTTARARSK